MPTAQYEKARGIFYASATVLLVLTSSFAIRTTHAGVQPLWQVCQFYQTFTQNFVFATKWDTFAGMWYIDTSALSADEQHPFIKSGQNSPPTTTMNFEAKYDSNDVFMYYRVTSTGNDNKTASFTLEYEVNSLLYGSLAPSTKNGASASGDFIWNVVKTDHTNYAIIYGCAFGTANSSTHSSTELRDEMIFLARKPTGLDDALRAKLWRFVTALGWQNEKLSAI